MIGFRGDPVANAMNRKRLESAYEATETKLLKERPALRDPTSAEGRVAAGQGSPHIMELTWLAAMLTRYEDARRWAAIGADGCHELIVQQKGQIKSWPRPGTPIDRKNTFEAFLGATCAEAAILAALAWKAPPKPPALVAYKEGVSFNGAKAQAEVDWYLVRVGRGEASGPTGMGTCKWVMIKHFWPAVSVAYEDAQSMALSNWARLREAVPGGLVSLPGDFTGVDLLVNLDEILRGFRSRSPSDFGAAIEKHWINVRARVPPPFRYSDLAHVLAWVLLFEREVGEPAQFSKKSPLRDFGAALYFGAAV